MSIDFNIGMSIACVCLFIALVTLIVFSGGCETIEEDIGLTARSTVEDVGSIERNSESTIEDVVLTTCSSESTIVENPAHNV